MPSIGTSIGMQKLLNKFITGQNNIPFITVLHRKGRFVFRPSDDRGCAYIPPPGLPSSKNSMVYLTLKLDFQKQRIDRRDSILFRLGVM